LWNHEGTAMLAFNHGEATDSGVVDTVSEVEWTDQNAPTPPPPAAKFGIAALADLNLLSPLANWFEKRRFIVGQNPAGAALAQGRDFVAVANEDSHSISLIDMADNSVQMIGVAASPYAVAFSPSGRYVFVVHETPLMPVSLVDTQTGGAWILYKSLSMYRWIQ
jgi:DNA-binding beta-propeller fold protein YncE